MKKFVIKSVTAFVFCMLTIGAIAQTGTILVISNAPAKVMVDGEELGQLKPNAPGKFEISLGEHYLQVIDLLNEQEKNEILKIEEGKQKVLRYEFANAQSTNDFKEPAPVQLTNVSLTIPGGFTQGLAASGDYESSGVPVFYFNMLKDDQLEVNFNMSNKNGTNSIEVASYPDGNTIYYNTSFQNLNGLKIRIPSDGIYKIVFGTAHVFDRTGQLVFNRIPDSQDKNSHDTKVIKKRRYEVVNVEETNQYWVNSIGNEEWQGGSSKIIIPVKLPQNTVEWYYTISASRDREAIQANLNSISLLKDLGKALGVASPYMTALNIGLDLINQPPGSDYCNVYLLDYNNVSLFKSNAQFSYILEGTRENTKSARVKVSGVTQGQYYLAIKNNAQSQGIGVGVEIAAITAEDYYDVVN